MKNMPDITSKIDRAIEEKAMKTGAMGAEGVRVTLVLTNEELDIFRSEEDSKYDSIHYFWDIKDNELTITYTEDV